MNKKLFDGFLISCNHQGVVLLRSIFMQGKLIPHKADTAGQRGKRLQRCQQGRPSPFVPINVHSYPKLYMCTLPSPEYGSSQTIIPALTK